MKKYGQSPALAKLRNLSRGKLVLLAGDLELENTRLRAEVEFLKSNPTVAKGLKGESLIANLIHARISKRGAGHDLESHKGSVLFEVKYSSLLKGPRNVKRWVWSKLYGERGNKKYNRLLLVGDVDPRFAHKYADPESPYIFFDLAYQDVIRFTRGIRPGRQSRMELTTNPNSVISSRASALFESFQVHPDELSYRYPDLKPL
jgi:hypothetical protein